MAGMDLENYKVENVARSAYYVREFVSAGEECDLLREVYSAPRPKWTQLSGRRLQNWGGTPHARGMLAERLPAWLSQLLRRLPAGAPPAPNHVLVNEYCAGQGILAHEDGPLFHPVVSTLSLGSHAVLRLWARDRSRAGALLLEPRSLLVLCDSLYTGHLHAIDEAAVLLGVYQGSGGIEMTEAARQFDQRSDGKLSRALSESAGRLRVGRALLVTEPAPGLAAAALACLGPRDVGYDAIEHLDVSRENVRVAVGAGIAALVARGATRVAVDACGAADAAAEAAELAAWKFQAFKSSVARDPEPIVSLLEGADAEASALWLEGAVRARAQNWARHLSDMPANKMTPVDLAQAALDELCPRGVRVEAHDRDWIATQNMQAFQAVARGSCETPMFLEAAYDGPGAGSGAPVLLVAKGVTFDSGGLCLKRPPSMVENRGSMAGVAVALAAMRALAELKVPLRVRLVAPLCENMISGQCMKVGDVVRALNGLSIQIEDTDMEGRLMMADALVYGQALHKPVLVVDVATLTHGVLQATGGGAFGCFSTSEAAWRAVREAGARSGDRPWRFPLWDYYHRQLTNDGAVDLRNKGSGRATPCLGAAFLKNFICGDWVHMDITGVGKLAHAPAPPYLDPRRMTGRPTRTLVQFLQDLAPPAAPAAGCDAPAAPSA